MLLIVAPGTIEGSYGRLSAAAGELPILGLAFIAASFRDQGQKVKIIDLRSQPLADEPGKGVPALEYVLHCLDNRCVARQPGAFVAHPVLQRGNQPVAPVWMGGQLIVLVIKDGTN